MKLTYLSQGADHLDHVAVSNSSALIRTDDFARIEGFQTHCAELQKDLKFLSEALICLHFSRPAHPLATVLINDIRAIILHKFTLRAARQNPLLATWLLNAVALLQDHCVVTIERRFAIELVEHFGFDTVDAPSYRTEENKYLFFKLQGKRYAPQIDMVYERNFYNFTRDQVYSLTHLLFYVSDYGTTRFSCSSALSCALEHLTYDAYLNCDVDLMLELMLVYRSSDRSEKETVQLFESLASKLIRKSPNLHHALTVMDSEYYPKFYHQSLLAMMYRHSNIDGNGESNRSLQVTYRALREAHTFNISLRSGNYVKAARNFTRLDNVDAAHLKFCRGNLDRYLALQRYEFRDLTRDVRENVLSG